MSGSADDQIFHDGWLERDNAHLEVRLLGLDPAPTRIVEAPLDLTLADLHRVIQAAMGWASEHLYEFVVGGLPFTDQPELDADGFPENEPWGLDAAGVTLADFQTDAPSFSYRYDFGDNWRHEVRFLKHFKRRPGQPLRPAVIDGRGACPPENVGGVEGYLALLEQIAAPEHPDHQGALEWVGGAFDPDAFDVEAADARLAGVFASGAVG